MDHNKQKIALGYYKQIMIDRILKLNNIEPVNKDKFLSHITHSDLNRLHKHNMIDKDTYEELFKKVH